MGGIGLRLQAASLVIPVRFTNDVFIRGCVLVFLNAGWRSRAVETAGWRYRAFENVRCAGMWRTAVVPRYPE